MSAEPTHTIDPTRVQNFLRKATGCCGGALNSFLVVLGSSEAADGAVHAHGNAIPGRDRAMRVHGDETAFMTLICHDCTPAKVSHKATP
jgi:hypothetical protein